jgi:hypothetical protein
VTNIGNPAAGALYPLKVLALPFGISRGCRCSSWSTC